MSSQNTIQILYVEPDSQSGIALKRCLSEYPDLRLAAEATSATEALEKLQSMHIDLALVDLGLSDLKGIELIKQIRQLHPNVRIVILTASDSAEDIFASMDAGADGYVLKGNLTNVLEMAIRSARLGAVWLDPGIARQVLYSMEPTSKGMKMSRVLPTGLLTIPLRPEEESVLHEVAGSNCKDGVCIVDPDFIRRLRRFQKVTGEFSKQ